MSEPGVRAGRSTRDAARRHRPAEPAPDRTLRSPFVAGFFLAAGALLAYWLGGLLLSISPLLILIVVAFFLAAGLNPSVEFFMRHGHMRRPYAVLVVTLIVLLAIALFLLALVPVIADQVSAIVANAPEWLDQLQQNRTVQRLEERYDLVQRARDFVQQGNFGSKLFGGVVGVGAAVLSAVANTFIVVVLTLYFVASLPTVKRAGYQLAPASRRPRVTELGDRILRNVGAYVSGAFIVAMVAGISSLIFLFVVGLGEYAVALAAVVALLDVIPMIGATIGAIIVTAIGFATDPKIGLACVVFYLAYQAVENYIVYPRVMARSVDIPGAVIVVAALIGAALLGVIGALLAIPTAAAILLIIREVVRPRQEAS